MGEASTDEARRLAVASLALARRFRAGATMWCVSPEWPDHARHVAVEFVHPVIVGKRALPAVAVDVGRDPVGTLRPLARSGDILVVIAGPDVEGVAALVQRARVWGLETVWIGPTPPPVDTDHVLCPPTGAETTSVRFDGSLVLVYHLLWELTHVCFEHPGLLTTDDACDDAGHCITCSDDALAVEVIDGDIDGTAAVRSAVGTSVVDTMLVGPVVEGDLLLVHAGAALSRIEPVDA